MLFPPYCSLTVEDVQQVGQCKLLLNVNAGISTSCPNVKELTEPDTEPEARMTHPLTVTHASVPFSLGTLRLCSLSLLTASCALCGTGGRTV